MKRYIRNQIQILSYLHASIPILSILILILFIFSNPVYTFAQDCNRGQWSLSDFRFKEFEAGIQPVLPANTVINCSIHFEISNSSNNPNRRQQIIIGILDLNDNPVAAGACIYDDAPNKCPNATKRDSNFTLTSPNKPGTYRIWLANFNVSSCAEAQKYFLQHTNWGEYTAYLSTITVSDSPIQMTPKSTAGLTVPPGTSFQNPIQTGVAAIVLWFTANLPWIIISIVSIAALCLIIWRLIANGFEFDTLIKVIIALAFVLILTTLFVFFTQQFINYLIFAGVAVLVFAMGFAQDRPSSGNPPSTISTGNKLYEIYTETTRKAEAHAIVRSLKRQGYFAFVRTYRDRFHYERSGVVKTGNNYIVYRCPK